MLGTADLQQANVMTFGLTDKEEVDGVEMVGGLLEVFSSMFDSFFWEVEI